MDDPRATIVIGLDADPVPVGAADAPTAPTAPTDLRGLLADLLALTRAGLLAWLPDGAHRTSYCYSSNWRIAIRSVDSDNMSPWSIVGTKDDQAFEIKSSEPCAQEYAALFRDLHQEAAGAIVLRHPLLAMIAADVASLRAATLPGQVDVPAPPRSRRRTKTAQVTLES